MTSFYVTTPIYYVNDVPHIGHLYTTTVADVVARFRRLQGQDVFFLTGTDEHAAKVVDAAKERGFAPAVWAEQNALAFQRCFAEFGIVPSDFIRTSEERHKSKVVEYVARLMASGDVYLGEYEGWYDAGQEEYVPDAKARELEFRSPINKKPLVRKREQNFFFKLSGYAAQLTELIESGGFAIQPVARKQEVLARIRDGLKDVPISRTGSTQWGIAVPGHPEHTIYVWIDALFNYLSTVDTDERRAYWPANVHLIGKDILWFHAVIWPALLLALGKLEGLGWMRPPVAVHAHGFWIREGEKMSKSMGNFVDLEELRRYVADFGLDALRHYLVSEGPLGAADSDFARQRFVDGYNSQLANTLGNGFSRVSNMINRYFAGQVPPPSLTFERIVEAAALHTEQAREHGEALRLDAMVGSAFELLHTVDGFIQQTEPFKLVKQPDKLAEVGSILYHAAEAIRIASVALWPVLPRSMEQLWGRLGLGEQAATIASGRAHWAQLVRWGQLPPGSPVQQGEPLFPRFKEA
ncbi:MAG: methionine--tRNA ligase [Deltaproteobacteria bacterium]